MVGFLQKLIEGETSFIKARDKVAKRGEASCKSLYSLYVLNRAHPRDGRDLLWVSFDATLGDDKTQQYTPWDPKNTLVRVEFDAVCSEFREGVL